MNKGILKLNLAFINSQNEKYESRASLLLKQGKLEESVRYYKYIEKNFSSVNSGTKEILDSILKSSLYLKEVKKSEKDRSWELEIQNRLISSLVKPI